MAFKTSSYEENTQKNAVNLGKMLENIYFCTQIYISNT